jgi:hypothetical protein
MGIVLDRVDLAIDENRTVRCLWVAVEYWDDFCAELGRGPNAIGVVVYRGKTIRPGEPYSEISTRRPGV